MEKVALRVLIVDDFADGRDALAGILRLWGHAVRTSASGSEALASLAEFTPDLVLLDIAMPDMDGYELCARLRQTDPGTRARVYAVSGFNTDDHRRQCEVAGFDGHLLKPVDLDALARLLEAH